MIIKTIVITIKTTVMTIKTTVMIIRLIIMIKKLINNSRGKYKRNECLINVCKSDTDLS